MEWLSQFYLSQPAMTWVAAAAALLALELVTGSGWLLWPAASAGVVALVEALARPPTTAALLLFALLTIVTTTAARRYLPRGFAGASADINDNVGRLVGHEGRVVGAFQNGLGRVFVDGKEWAAELEGDARLEPGARVEVTAVAGAILKVRSV